MPIGFTHRFQVLRSGIMAISRVGIIDHSRLNLPGTSILTAPRGPSPHTTSNPVSLPDVHGLPGRRPPQTTTIEHLLRAQLSQQKWDEIWRGAHSGRVASERNPQSEGETPLWKKFSYKKRQERISELKKKYADYDPPVNLIKIGQRTAKRTLASAVVPTLMRAASFGAGNYVAGAVSRFFGKQWIPRDVQGTFLPASDASTLAVYVGSEVAFSAASSFVTNSVTEFQDRNLPQVKDALICEAMYKELRDDSKEYEKILPKETKEVLQQIDFTINAMINDCLQQPMMGFDRKRVEMFFDRRELVLASHIPDEERYPDAGKRETLRTNLYAIADEYFAPETSQPLKNVFDKIVDGTPRPNLCLEGNGGTYKTMSAKDIADALDCPLLDRYTFHQLANANFFGPMRDGIPDAAASERDLLGEFGYDLLTNRERSGIKFVVCLDDMPDLETPEYHGGKEDFKKATNPKLSTFFCHGLGGVPMNFKDVLFIETTNYKIKDGPIQDRLRPIHTKVAEHKKHDAANLVLTTQLAKLPKETAEDRALIERLSSQAKPLLPFIVGIDIKLNDGVRVLEDISENMFSALKRYAREGIAASDAVVKAAILNDFHRGTSLSRQEFDTLIDRETALPQPLMISEGTQTEELD